MDDTQQRIGESVRALVAMHQHKQAELAVVLGVSQKAVSQKLNGNITWQLRDLEAVSKHYGVRTDALIAGPRAWLKTFLEGSELTNQYVLDRVAA